MAKLQPSGALSIMEMLKLVALDEEDLAVISAYAQDAVMKVENLDYSRPSKQFILAMGRFAWEAASSRKAPNERRQSVLNFGRVLAVKAQGIDPSRKQQVLSLLTIRFTAAEAPAGAIELVFAGGASIRLEVECIEARLSDLGGAWSAISRPAHPA